MAAANFQSSPVEVDESVTLAELGDVPLGLVIPRKHIHLFRAALHWFGHFVEPARPAHQVAVGADDQLIPLRGPALRIAENMAASLTMPVATSQRAMPVKVIDENRRLINQHRAAAGQSKLSYTHIVAWSIVRAIEAVPAINQAYSERGEESFRVARGHVNLGIDVDVAGKDGARSLTVPGVKAAEAMNFAQFIAAYDDLVSRARGNKLA